MNNAVLAEKKCTRKADFHQMVLKNSSWAMWKKLADAEGKPLATYLSEVGLILMRQLPLESPEQGELIPMTPQQQVLERMSGFDHRLASIGRDLDRIAEYLLFTEHNRLAELGDKAHPEVIIGPDGKLMVKGDNCGGS